jgi:hypothetical protein
MRWSVSDACDGFMVSPAYLPGSFDHFVEHITHATQSCGPFRTAYVRAKLREHLKTFPAKATKEKSLGRRTSAYATSTAEGALPL